MGFRRRLWQGPLLAVVVLLLLVNTRVRILMALGKYKGFGLIRYHACLQAARPGPDATTTSSDQQPVQKPGQKQAQRARRPKVQPFSKTVYLDEEAASSGAPKTKGPK